MFMITPRLYVEDAHFKMKRTYLSDEVYKEAIESFIVVDVDVLFVNRIKKHGGQAGNVAIRILGQQWVDFTLEESIRLDGERLEQAVEYLRSFVAEGEVTLEAKLLAFPTGQQLLDYVEEVKVALVRDEVVQ